MSGAVTIFHNPRCSTSRFAVEAAEASKRRVRVRNYLKDPLSEKELAALIDTLDNDPGDLVRRDKKFQELGLGEDDVQSGQQVVELLVEHPELMQRPVLIRHDLDANRAIIGRPRDQIEPFLA